MAKAIIYTATRDEYFDLKVKNAVKKFGAKALVARLFVNDNPVYVIQLKGSERRIYHFIHDWLKKKYWWERHDEDMHGLLSTENMIGEATIIGSAYYEIPFVNSVCIKIPVAFSA